MDAEYKLQRFALAVGAFRLAEGLHAKDGDSALPELRRAARAVLDVTPSWAEVKAAHEANGNPPPEGGEAGFLAYMDSIAVAASTPEELQKVLARVAKTTWN